MIRMALAGTLVLGLSACAFPRPYEADPASPAQWQRRQEGIERREAERMRLCQMMNTDSERYERDCRRPGDPIR